MWNKDDTRPIRARTKDGGRVVELNYPISMLAAIKKVHGLHPYSFIPLRSGGRLYLGDLDDESFDELNRD